MKRNILVTGCAGFIGSNFVPYFLDKYNEYNIINLDLLAYTTKLENTLGWKADENFDSGIVKTIEWYLGKYNDK